MLEQTDIEKTSERPATRILVVDDDAELCELVAEYLVPEGFRIDSVYDGVQGLEARTTAMARSARGSLSPAYESDSKRCGRSLEKVHAADGSPSGISHAQERVGHPAAVPSTGKAGE